MHWINWLIVIVYVVWVVVDGIRKSKDTDTVSGYFLANKSLSWWVVGLSVMATQLSAVTMPPYAARRVRAPRTACASSSCTWGSRSRW